MANWRMVTTETPVAMKIITASFLSLRIEPQGGE